MTLQTTVPARMGVGLKRREDTPSFTFLEFAHPGGHRVPSHRHTGPAAVLSLGGAFDWHEGRRRTTTCASGTLLVVPPAEQHSETIHETGAHSLIMWPSPDPEDAEVSLVDRLVVDTPRTRIAALRCRQALRNNDDLVAVDLNSLSHELLATAANEFVRAASGTPRWLGQVRDRLHDEFAERHTLADLAREAGVSRTRLAAGFRRTFGVTIGEYMRQRRIERAAEALERQRQQSVLDIALDCGFYDQSHFGAAFRRQIGITPLAYRRATRG